MRHYYYIVLLLIAVISTQGCGKDRILYSESMEIGAGGWDQTDVIRFVFAAGDTSRVYDLLLDVNHDPDYPWQNCYVLITTEFPGDSVKQDILSLDLSNRMGGWAGRCRGNICRVTIPLQTAIRFPLAGDYAISFEQYMRIETVPGISGLSLTVRESVPEVR